MTDTLTPQQRSHAMRRVKATDTSPELAVRRALHAKGYRFRLHRKDLPGKPDLAFPSRRAVLFVHGCFWHGHDCKRGARTPKTNTDYWLAKIARNKARDARNIEALNELGWRNLTVWECELADKAAAIARIERFLDAPGRGTSP
ncbi:MAG: DNA mismatch endonuclease Vsr [Alphaproteobacteria bacterium]|nr:DNA mismatch endonuclease Vsr [Alphaproteobacteria bacterium]